LRKISSLNQFLQFLVEENFLVENPMVDIKRPAKEKSLPKFLKPAEIEILIENAKKDNKFGIRMALIIDFLYASGMRISELLTLRMSDIKNAEKLIMIKGKGNKERLVPLRKQTFGLLEKYLEVRKDFVSSLDGDKYLFCSRGGTGHLTREMVGMELKKVALLSNIDPTRVSPHVLRHSFATNLVNKKVNLRVVQELLGHSDISTTEIYIDTMDSEIVDFVKENHPMSN
jgi:integrase/recombinase XerD